MARPRRQVSKGPALQVFKFGGSSVGSPEAVRMAAGHVMAAKGHVVVVVSAMQGVTDLLLAAAQAAHGGNMEDADAAADVFQERHQALIKALVPSVRAASELTGILQQSTDELRSMCRSVAILRELTVRTRDAVVARGERMLARIFTAFLEQRRRRATYLDATEIIHTERRHQALWPAWSTCERNVRDRLLPLLRRGVVIVPGFIGLGPDGELVTLGRGGTDFSAAILARSAHAGSVTLFKEVDGLMTADPRHVKDARVVPELHYREAAELAYYGAKILHPRTMMPLVEAGIPLFIKNLSLIHI